MARRYSEPVEVRPVRIEQDDGTDAGMSGIGASDIGARGIGGAAAGSVAPGSFIWRGRLYIVRSVLGYWRERRAWWTSASARALHGEVEVEDEIGAGGGDPTFSSSLGEEHEVWRVEASAGRGAGSGVYDLRHERATTSSAGDGSGRGRPGGCGTWRLQQVAD